TGEPLPGVMGEVTEGSVPNRVVAKAVKADESGKMVTNPEAGMTCMALSGDIGQDGTFALAGLCASATAYQLSIEPDKNYFLGETNGFDMGAKLEGPQTIKAWRAPNGAGVNILRKDGTTLEAIRSRQKLKTEKIMGTAGAETVQYPEGIKGVPVIAKGEYLQLAGKTNVGMTIQPLINSGARKFEIEGGDASMDPWSYIGTSFTSDTEFQRVSAKVDAGKVVTVEKGDHAVKFVPAEAVAPGRYAVMSADGKTAYLVDFGTAGEMPAAAAAAPE
ncbi:MAG: hypothetical protein AB8H79_25265, partial [Myxococcota bacterium]